MGGNIIYTLKPLDYQYDALEPFVDTHSLGIHHNKHLKNYLDNLNLLLLENGYDFKSSPEQLAKDINNYTFREQDDIIYNLGGVVNHNLYFSSMSPNKTMPNKILLDKIEKQFGSFDNFKRLFKEKALSIRDSGYTFLVLNNDELEIVNFKNQDNPYTENYIPLIGIDMWEHAYYINNENYKDSYINNFFEVLDFSSANKIFNEV